jgi:hypothetical protein
MKQSLLKGKEIFNELLENLNMAKQEIVVVSAWFTDQELLDVLLVKLKQGIKVSLVIGDNKDNDKLDFEGFEKSGGYFKRIKGNGYGIMHQKYCVIDGIEAFHGSYNWTVNARKNNSESVIKTNHKNTIQELIKDFKNLTMVDQEEIVEKINGEGKLSRFFKKSVEVAEVENETIEEEEKKVEEIFEEPFSVDEVFKSIISAEIKKTNRGEIKEIAYKQAKEVSGDSQVISKSMDSLYHLFVSDKKENDENKEVLFKKIEDKVSEFHQNISSEKDEKLHSIEIEVNSEEKMLEFKKTEVLGKKANNETKKKNVLETAIPNIEKEISNLKNKVTELDIEFVKPMFKYHEFIPQILFFVGLALAMVLFYSSSAYIMLYSYDDAMEAMRNGISVNPQVYEAKAFSKAISKGGSAFLYIMFFVFIPFTIAYVVHDIDTSGTQKLWAQTKKILSYIVVVVIDGFIAVKVSSTISEIDFLTKGIEAKESVWFDINFWLVFFLGAIPFVFLAELMNKIINFFAERNAQSGREKMLLEKKIANDKINILSKEVIAKQEEVNNFELELNNFNSEISKFEQELIFLPKELNSKTRQVNEQANNRVANVRKKADVYKNDIENDNVEISLSSLKDRVSAFIEGWNEWLHDEYAINKAINKSEEAILESDLWLEENMKKIEL